jgi:hypothetical protein
MSHSLNPIVDELLNEFAQEDERKARLSKWIDELPDDKLMEALKNLNPYGVTLPVKTDQEESFSISYTNMRLEFVKRLVTTSMIGFMLKMLKEWKCPDEIKPVDPADYIKDHSLADPPSYIKDEPTLKKYSQYKESMRDRVAVWEFLQFLFEFDPDRHVASALQTNLKDPSRKVPDVQSVRNAILNDKNTVRKTVKPSDYEAKSSTDLSPAEDVIKTEEAKSAYTLIPPLDTFSRYDRYLEEHYEQYQDLTNAIYGTRPDIDFCLIVYDKHESKDQSKTFKERYMEQVIAPITNITKNRWVALGPYRENREKIDFYNRHTEVLKEMIDQRERDSHVATDIMKKRIKIKKAQNIKESGPDDKEFRKYLKANRPEIAKLGGEHIKQDDVDSSSDEEKDTVEINVFQVDDGGRELKVHKIYNPVEAPVVGGPSGPSADNKKELQ